MESKKRTQRRASIDGFVRRQPRRAVQSGGQKRSGARKEGFTSRAERASQPVSFTDEAWSEAAGTLMLDTDGAPVDAGQNKPSWWRFRKRRQYKRNLRQLTREKHAKSKRRIKRIAIIVAILVLAIGAFLGWKFLSTSSKVFDGNVLGFLNTTKLKGEDQGRVNIVLAGTSEDDPDHGGAMLTDSIMLGSIDTKNNTAFTTSIPRDLWVRYGYQCSAGYEGKINNVYECGESIEFDEPGYPRGGMGMLMKVISINFGIPVQYYGKINYTAFKDAVDAVGGIEITVDSSDPRGIYDPNIQPKDGGPVRLKNGVNKLDGLHALALARSRNAHGGYGLSRGDFDRTKYQREMLIALKNKALSVGVLSNPAKIGSLLDAAGDNVDTNFNTGELRRLYDLSKLIKNDSISSIDLADPEEPLVKTGSYNGQSIVMPAAGLRDYSEIKSYFKRATSTDPLVREEATAVVLNGSGTTGLAQKYADKLAEKGIEVLVVSNAQTDRTKNVLINLSKDTKPKTKAYLAKDLGVSATTNTTSNPEGNSYKADFVIILGKTSTAPTQ